MDYSLYMKNEQEFREHFQALQARFATARQENIVALQREYNAAIDAFRKWARANHVIVKQDNKTETTLKIYKVEGIGANLIRIID